MLMENSVDSNVNAILIQHKNKSVRLRLHTEDHVLRLKLITSEDILYGRSSLFRYGLVFRSFFFFRYDLVFDYDYI